MKRNKLGGRTSGDAILLMSIKLVTVVLSFVVTRLLSQYLTVYDYGTYSQILLVISTVTSLTVLGMVDGVNYFYCSEKDINKRESYISTIFALQCIVSTIAGTVVLVICRPLCIYFDNPDVRNLIVFAATLPLLQNLLSMIQVLLVSVGKARMIAFRNLFVSALRLIAVIVVISFVRNVAVILLTTLLLDLIQILLFGFVLKNNGCTISFKLINVKLVRLILSYCVPMAVFTVISTLNRDVDKYLIAMMTDTETVAMYSNASKVLPFDIIMSAFCTVLLPEITRRISSKEYDIASSLYKCFLEISYISTGICCCASLSAAPQLMTLLYSDKYINGLDVFCIYILVDLIRFTNITLVLSAAGKTKILMGFSLGALLANAVSNVVLFNWLGIIGPAIATLLTTAVLGLFILCFGAKALNTKIRVLFDIKYLMLFVIENVVSIFLLYNIQKCLVSRGLHYIVILLLIGGMYGIFMLAINGKRLVKNLQAVNLLTKKQ